MEIVVEGKGTKEVLPDLIKINLDFKFVEKTYDKALEVGTNSVLEFTNNVLPKIGLKKDDMRTIHFSIEHLEEMDYDTRRKKDMGYQYWQKAILELDYNNDTINIFMTEIIKLTQIPQYNMEFDLKEKEKIIDESLSLAYENAEKKAKIVATTSKLKLKKCQRVDYNPIENIHFDNIPSLIKGECNLEIPTFLRKNNKTFTGFTSSFTPEKIKIEQIIYTLWIAE